MIRVDIETIIMASGPVPSVIVLRERGNGESANAPSRSLSIQTGSVEAAAISRGIDNSQNNGRPITHDLFIETLRQLNVKLERVEINRVDAPVFFARLVLMREGADEQIEELAIDARPSDALALAVRSNAPVFVEDDVMNRAGTISYRTAQQSGEDEFKQFDQFVQTLSPDDF